MTTAVAVALYNGARFVEQQLDTIRLQTQKPDRVVLCDDGSGDGTVAIVREYIEKYGLGQAWRLYENPENLGYVRNFYQAISLCDAELVFLSDQDDLWKLDKIEKMTAVMERCPEVNLLSCRYAIIDAQGETKHSLVEPEANEDEAVVPVTVQNIMVAYRWPGMLMCLRKSFFKNILPAIENSKVAHDLMLTVCAADCQSFYEYHYMGAWHRRHDNNTAQEEHRVFKLLDLKRKLRDMEVYNALLIGLLEERLPVTRQTADTVAYRLRLSKGREEAIRSRSFRKLRKVYASDDRKLLRTASWLCDIWLLCFGRYKDISQ